MKCIYMKEPLSPVNFKQLVLSSWSLTRNFFGNEIFFYAPEIVRYQIEEFKPLLKERFVAISITGSSCALKCDHCRGLILQRMIPAETPEKFLRVCKDLHRMDVKGILVSGGSMLNGSVPLTRFCGAIKIAREKYGFLIMAHTGLVDEQTAAALKESGVDVALIDVIGDDETIKLVYHLDATTKDFEKSLLNLERFKIKTVPHIVVGLHYGEIRGELKSLEMIRKYSPEALVFVVITPFKGTPMENVEPPEPIEVASLIASSRHLMPKTPIILGCARPKGKWKIRTDLLSLRAGVNAVAYPSREVIRYAERIGLKVNFSTLCCAAIINELTKTR